jgi:glutathione synthase/RimK-type ligase-like ATP-grasp enzyme
MILIVTNREDLTADWLILELQRRGAPYVRFNTEDYPQRAALDWRIDEQRLHLDGRELTGDDIQTVWYRRPVSPVLRPGLPSDDSAWATREAAEALEGFWRTLDARWVSPPPAIRLADCKALQLRDAAALGFDVPDTEITSNIDRVRALIDRSQHGVVCKPLRDGRVRGGGRSLMFTSLIDAAQLDGLEEEPHLFQAFVPKRHDLRVTVIGDEIFSTRIEAPAGCETAVDWRRSDPDSLRYQPEALPKEIADRCRALVELYGLSFAAIDLALRNDGGHTFFEVNPNGQWAFIEQRTGQPLRAALADLLTGAA